MSNGESDEKETVDLVRGPKKADLRKVSTRKLREAHEKRGVNIEVNADHPNQTKITKTIVEDIPAPKIKEEND